ncbi:hypothetical protein [Streptomyces platensis]|uniref:hypothetical protein n=1 Tax=Streptomyces platensis TaxID=58346 RepID=UPI00332F280A
MREDQMRVLDRLAGRPRSVPAPPVIVHIGVLRASGMSWAQIGRAAGLSESNARKLHTSGAKSVLRRTAEAVLAVRPGEHTATGFVSPVGTVRRLRALFALGHSRDELARLVGVTPTSISNLVGGEYNTVRVGVAAAVRAAYDGLSMTVGSSTKNRLRAAREGWAPPLAWDEDDLDNPEAGPCADSGPALAESGEKAVARWLMGESVVLDQRGRREAIAYLMEWTTDSPEEIAARLESTPDAVSRAWERIKEKARQEGRPVPWRRKLELARRNELTKREMETAA